jgi:hypothetical protein
MRKPFESVVDFLHDVFFSNLTYDMNYISF